MKFLNGKGKKTENETQATTADTQPPIDRDKKIEELEAEIEKAREGVIECDTQIEQLSNAQRDKERIYGKELEKILVANPDASVKKQIDLVYQTSNRDLKQVKSNLEKMFLLKGRYALQERIANTKLAELKETMRTEALDEQVSTVVAELRAWIKAYKETQSLFDILKQTLCGMPEYHKYRDRIDALGLPGALHVIVDSHLRNPANLSMDRLALSLSEMVKGSDPYNVPDDLRIEFDYTRDSDKPAIRDSFETGGQSFGTVEDVDEKVMNAL